MPAGGLAIQVVDYWAIVVSGSTGDVLVGVLLGCNVLMMVALVDIATRSKDEWPVDGQSRGAWVAAVLLLPIVGLVMYYVRGPGRHRKRSSRV